MEELQLSESDYESEDGCDIYDADPVFVNQEDLDEFLTSCKIEKAKKVGEGEQVNFNTQKGIMKLCTCKNCEDIRSGDFEHICCHQIRPG